VAGNLQPEPVDGRQSVERSARHVRNEDGEIVAPVQFRSRAHIKPRQHLPHDAKRNARVREELCRPRAGRDDQRRGAIGALPCRHLDPATDRLPLTNRFLAVNLGAERHSGVNVCANALLHVEETGRLLEHTGVIRRETERGEAAVDLGAGQFLGRQCTFADRCAHALNVFAALGAGVQAGAFGEQVLAAQLFQFVPPLERPAHERDVGRSFRVRGANDARVAVRTAATVDERELLQSQHAPTAAGQLEARGRSHPAHAQHDHVEGSRHRFSGSVSSAHP
jgi:hypothetical protein